MAGLGPGNPCIVTTKSRASRRETTPLQTPAGCIILAASIRIPYAPRSPLVRKAIIGVMGGARVTPAVEEQAEQLGCAIAARGWILLNGGRDCGVMAASARGARAEGGTTVGILPGQNASSAAPDVDIAVVTGMGDARNLVNVLSSTVVVAMPGGTGTASEVALALKNGKRVILFGFPDSPLFTPHRQTGQLSVASNVEEVIAQATTAIEAMQHDDV